MGRTKQPPEYFEARRALARHLFRHHGRTGASGTLSDRLDVHEELHIVAARRGVTYGHDHEPWDGETDSELAFRLLREGEDQNGQGNASGNS